MPRTSKRTPVKSKKPAFTKLPFHAFWSGSLSFGLVNVPVLMFPSTRHSGVRLRLMSPQGALLERHFFCPSDGKEVRPDEIVRGYELEDGTYIVVDNEELEALEPQKSREIDLREFVDLSELPPTILERGYYLTPQKEATKAYRLLAEAMEQTRQAGIATFVMRDREYLVAIFARNGILCAETLRFRDEIRDPEAIGLPKPSAVDKARVTAFERSIDALFRKTLSGDELADRAAEKLKSLIEKKRKAGRDVIRTEHDSTELDSEEDSEGEVDLLETIRQSLRHAGSNSATHRRPTASGKKKPSGARKDDRAMWTRMKQPSRARKGR